MERAIITGSGLFTPKESISNQELVDSLAVSVARWNEANRDAISAGRVLPREGSSDAFIVKASGIERRYVIEKSGILDPDRMRPHLPTRREGELSVHAEVSVAAANEALKQAGRCGEEVDALLLACSNLPRAYPATAIEVQAALGARGFAYDLNVACSSATFGIQAAADAVRTGSASCVLVVNPEITSAHNCFELRDHHFIFGDACTAVVVERAAPGRSGFEILSTRMRTQFSNSIRNDFGFLNPSEDEPRDRMDLVFRQNGRQVFKEVCPLVADHIKAHLEEHGIEAGALRRMWLHQANLNMNRLIGKSVLGRPATDDEAPVILDEYANTSSAGSVIAFHEYKDDLTPGELGLLCSFGGGYSVGSVILKRV